MKARFRTCMPPFHLGVTEDAGRLNCTLSGGSPGAPVCAAASRMDPICGASASTCGACLI